MNDMRSPLARARDKWLESEEGKRCSQVGTLSSNPTYLINRLVCAFVAGSNSARADGLAIAEKLCNLWAVDQDETEMIFKRNEMEEIFKMASSLREKASAK